MKIVCCEKLLPNFGEYLHLFSGKSLGDLGPSPVIGFRVKIIAKAVGKR
jgi:hypothetical protein